MCSYNAVNGIPSCASSWLIQDVLRDYYGFGEDRWVTGDCGAVANVFDGHHYAESYMVGAAASIKAGTDLDCGGIFNVYLPEALSQGLISVDDLKTALVRQYISLVR